LTTKLRQSFQKKLIPIFT